MQWISYHSIHLLGQTERAKNFLLFAQIADDLLFRQRGKFDHGGRDEDCLGQCAHRFLQDINHLDAMALRKMLPLDIFSKISVFIFSVIHPPCFF